MRDRDFVVGLLQGENAGIFRIFSGMTWLGSAGGDAGACTRGRVHSPDLSPRQPFGNELA